MLSSPTTFPQIGSFALWHDPAGGDGAAAELARIVGRIGDSFVIDLPLRDGASGTRRAGIDELGDCTNLTAEEVRELADLDRALRARTVPRTDPRPARRLELRQRAMNADIAARHFLTLARRHPNLGRAA